LIWQQLSFARPSFKSQNGLPSRIQKGLPRFVAFDLLDSDGQYLTYSPLMERKQRFRAILPKESQSVVYCDHVEAAGEELFALVCKRDLDGIVAKHKFGRYLQYAGQWLKIRNRKYSQWAGREKFFGRERDVDPDMTVWDSCARTVGAGG
jgi:ATP-dependent DNA ligase